MQSPSSWNRPRRSSICRGEYSVLPRNKISRPAYPLISSLCLHWSLFIQSIKQWNPKNCPCRLCKIYMRDLGFLWSCDMYFCYLYFFYFILTCHVMFFYCVCLNKPNLIWWLSFVKLKLERELLLLFVCFDWQDWQIFEWKMTKFWIFSSGKIDEIFW